MTKPTCARFAALYHLFIAALVLLTGGGLLALGIWLQTSENVAPSKMPCRLDTAFELERIIFIVLITLGATLFPIGLIGLYLQARKFNIPRIGYILCITLIAGSLALCSVVCAYSVARKSDKDYEKTLQNAWEDTVTSKESVICIIERVFGCRGFSDMDCDGCSTGDEDGCIVRPNCVKCGRVANVRIGCFDEIVTRARKVFLPTAISTAIVSSFVMIAGVLSCWV